MTTTTTDRLASDLYNALDNECSAWANLETTRLRCQGVEAQTNITVRRKALEAGDRISEAQIVAWITLDADVVAARLEAIDAELAYRQAKAEVARVETVVSLRKAALYSTSGRVA